MSIGNRKLSRRGILGVAAGAGAAAILPASVSYAEQDALITRPIPSTGEDLPVIGLGTSRTFDAGDDQAERATLAQALQAFFDNGGTLIDSSPMYRSAEQVVGDLVKEMANANGYFAATKVWIEGKEAGVDQMNKSMELMGVDVMDLMQIHNLRDWQTQLATLREWKDQGKIRYIGITTSNGRAHEEFEQIMKTEELDFVQFSYNIGNRVAEERLLPLAQDRGQATLINRPYQRGALFDKVKDKTLPEWAAKADIASWGQFFLKFILAHSATTNIIPATSDAGHMVDNMGAGYGRVPDAEMRGQMIDYFEAL